MPSGYTAATLWAIAVILWWTGWKRELADGLPKAAVTGFLVAWPFLARLSLIVPALGCEITVNACFLWTLAFAIAAAARAGIPKAGTACAAGVLIGSITLFTDKLSGALPSLLPASPLWVSSAIVAVVAALLTRSAPEQIVALTTGFALTESIFALWELHSLGQAHIGFPSWSDRWWLSYAGSRMLAVGAEWLFLIARRSQWGRGGQRS